MTEKEALEKLEFFKNAIISLKGRISELEKQAAEREEEMREKQAAFDNALKLRGSDIDGLTHKNRALQDDINYLEKTIAELKENAPDNTIEQEFADYRARTEKRLKEADENEKDLHWYKEWYHNLQSKQENANNDIAELKSKLEEAEKETIRHKDAYGDLKTKTYHTIKHLVEDVIEPAEAKIAEKDKKIANLETALSAKNSSENVMIVKSAERELKEMIDQS